MKAKPIVVREESDEKIDNEDGEIRESSQREPVVDIEEEIEEEVQELPKRSLSEIKIWTQTKFTMTAKMVKIENERLQKI